MDKMGNIPYICLFLLCFSTWTSESLFIKSKLNLTEYYSMPSQYSGDDFVRCMIEGEDALWCTAYNIIKPNKSNPTWEIIEKYSKDTKRFYRHDLVQAGVCIKWCQKKLEGIDNETLSTFYEPEFDFGAPYKIDDTLFYNSSEYKRQYDYVVNVCRNMFFTETYGLRAHSGLVYCYSSLEDKSPDPLDWTFLVLLLILIGLLGFSTITDIILKQKPTDSDESYYASLRGKSLALRLTLAFSIPRNWYRLKQGPKSEQARDLRYIQGLRFTTMFLVVYGHAVITYGFSPVTNTEFVEEQYLGFWDMVVINGMNVVQTFFAISGFLMGVQFFDMIKNRTFKYAYFWLAIIYRYIRLTPVYAFVILFEATWQYKLDNGPFWKTTTETEKSFCRRNWWTNLLYINNYVNPSQMCLIQTWYLAADFQLFVVGLLLVMAMWKYPAYKKHLLMFALSVSYVIPAVITYVKKYEGVFSLSPHDKKFIFHPLADGFINYYIPSHTNAGNYFAGLGMAMLYQRYKESRVDIKKYKLFVFGFYGLVPVGFFAFFAAYPFYAYEFEKPAIWIALYASLSKNIWGMMGAVLMFGFIGKIGGFVRDFFHFPIFTPLGRIAYCIYLVHFISFRFLTGDLMALPSVSNEQITLLTCGGFFVSVFMGLALCLALEFPFTALLKELISAGSKEKPHNTKENLELGNDYNSNNNNGKHRGDHMFT